tara:strand:+ start:2520 stop:3137 length:618 start_codon:yes stop_codon:yes gene_type:complete
MKPLVKICGINDLKILNELVEIDEISFLGFIFYENSPRNVTKDFLNKIKSINFKNKRPVCVYVNESKQFIEETSSFFDKPVLQFHGYETNEFCNSFKKDFWKVIRVKREINNKELSEYKNASAILFENYKKNFPGGTGSSFNWDLLRNIKTLDMKIILSGGINIKNVDNAININPWCIDINSGVESSAGIKELKLINEILKFFNK